MQLKRKITASSGMRDFCVCKNQKIFLAVVYDIIKIYDTDIGTPINCIKLDSCPRVVKLAPNGTCFAVMESYQSIVIYDVRTGIILQVIRNIPSSINNMRFSGNSQKIIFANNQQICLWNIQKCMMQIRSSNWKNINSFDVSFGGTQFALGTYNGTVFILNFLGSGRCTQIQIRRQTTCIVAVCFHLNKLISVSYDGFVLISTLSTTSNGQRLVSYNQMKISTVPRQIQSVGNNFYFFDFKGVTWFTQKFVLIGLVDSRLYKVLENQQGQIIFVKLVRTQVEWWSLKNTN